MRRKLLIGVLGASLVTGAALAQAPEGAGAKGKQPGKPGELLQRADSNRDGKISFDEMKAAHPQTTQERFNGLDRNGDGFVSAADRPEGRGSQGQRAESDPDARRQLMQKLAEADANKDGKASFDEVSAAKPGFAKADFDRVDRDKDGFITAKDSAQAPQAGERPRKPGAGRGEALTPEMRKEFREQLQAADKDGDGAVSRAEAKASLPSMTDERFARMDRNGDGKIGPGDRPEKPGAAPAKP